MRDSNTLLIELFPLQNYTIFFTYANFSSKKNYLVKNNYQHIKNNYQLFSWNKYYQILAKYCLRGLF